MLQQTTNTSNISSIIQYGLGLLIISSIVFFIDFIIYIPIGDIYMSMTAISWVYYFFASFGFALLISSVLYIIAYFPLALLTKKKNIAILSFGLLFIIAQFFLIANAFVFHLYKFHINGFVLDMLISPAAKDIFVFNNLTYFYIVLSIIIFAIIPYLGVIYLSNKIWKSLYSIILLIGIFFAICLVVGHLGHVFAYAQKEFAIQKSATALPYYYPMKANTLMNKIGVLKEDEIDRVSNEKYPSNLKYPLTKIQRTDSIPNFNIVFIAIDSWNVKTFNQDNMPNVSKMSKISNNFSNHLSSSNGTRGSIFGIYFGVPFNYMKEFNSISVSPVIVNELINRNYDIKVFPSANFTNPPFHKMVFGKVPNINLRGEGSTVLERDIDITNKFNEFLDKHKKTDKPFFSFLFYDLPHAITLPKEKNTKYETSLDSPDYVALTNDYDSTSFFNLYKNCVYVTDSLIGSVLENMKEKNLLENTVVIITGDHSQEFNENKKNYWGHGSNFTKWQIHIPFIIYYPGIEEGKTFEHTTTHYDIASTITKRFLGVKNPSSDFSLGKDLWDNSSRLPHPIGDEVRYGFILQNAILTHDYSGITNIYNFNWENIDRKNINAKELHEAIMKKNAFYK